ncbi:hypothetical protein BHE74_00003257 [Ensete ventricosum]|nr:hypothetical protein GW17_00008721 [Ensete ventricosum]RWW87895.1 hypothetical protein BHE74_00003257 [Ensete ventricosum]RZR76277.1 hypothetical protein BHM03_00000961 [Ensete ventricosum]
MERDQSVPRRGVCPTLRPSKRRMMWHTSRRQPPYPTASCGLDVRHILCRIRNRKPPNYEKRQYFSPHDKVDWTNEGSARRSSGARP